MSGGHFQYGQHTAGHIADEIEMIADNNASEELDDWGCRKGRNYPPEVIARFREAVEILRRAEVYAHEIDYLLSGDTGEESFLRRLEMELSKWNADTTGGAPAA